MTPSLPTFPQSATRVSGRRLVAQLVDYGMWVLPWLIGELLGSSLLGAVLFVVWFLGYLGWLQGTTGWTLGKLVAGVRTVGADARPVGTRKCIARSLPLFFEIFGVIALIFMLRSPWRQRAGDRWAGTYVVHRSAAL